MVIRYNGIDIDSKRRTIVHDGRTANFSVLGRTFEKISYFILAGGASFEMAFYQFYGDDPDGGPLRGPLVFNVGLNQWQRRHLTGIGLEWRSYRIAGVSFYEIVPKSLAVPPQRYIVARKRGGGLIQWDARE